MTFKKTFGALVFGLLAPTLAATGCGGDEDTTSDSSAGQPVAAPSGAAAATKGTRRTFAINNLNLGVGDGWKTLGYNLDGKVTKPKATDVCKPKGVAEPIADGANGIDNAFGAKILAQLANLKINVDGVNTNLTDGNFSVLLDVDGLTDAADQTNTALTAQIFPAAAFDATGAKKPAFDKTDSWPVYDNVIVNGDVNKSKIVLDGAYINKGQFVGRTQTLTLSLTIAGAAIALDIESPIITFTHSGSDLKTGVIAGVLNTQKLIETLKAVGPSISADLCKDPSQIDNVVAPLAERSSDSMVSGANTGGTCDGISIGIGFTAKEVAVPTKVAKASTAPTTCAP